MIDYLVPVLAVGLAALLLGEVVGSIRWFGVLFCFLGVLILVLPTATAANVDKSYSIGLALAMAVLTAGTKNQIRSLVLTENAGAIAFYFALTCTVASLATLPLGWRTPNWTQLGLLVYTEFAGGIAHILMTLSYQYSEVSKLAAFEYLSIVFAVIADANFFDIMPVPAFCAAAACIITATIVVAMKDSQLSPQAAHR